MDHRHALNLVPPQPPVTTIPFRLHDAIGLVDRVDPRGRDTITSRPLAQMAYAADGCKAGVTESTPFS